MYISRSQEQSYRALVPDLHQMGTGLLPVSVALDVRQYILKTASAFNCTRPESR